MKTTYCMTLFVFWSSLSFSQDIQIDCSESLDLSPEPVLQNLYNASKKFAQQTCKSILDDPIRASEDRVFLTGGEVYGAKDELLNFYYNAFSEAHFPDVKRAKLEWHNYNPLLELESDTYEYTAGYVVGNNFGFHGPVKRRIGVRNPSPEMETECQSHNYSSCLAFFNDIQSVTNLHNHFIRKTYTDQVLFDIRQIRDDWTKFSDESRFQTPLDILFTSYIYSDELSDGLNLQAPPKFQYFLLHPSLVIDHFSDAQGGGKNEIGIAVEWIGINDWDAKLPWGVSLASVYADREQGRSVGHGVMLHINNTFSFGMVSRGGGDNSIFVNIEFMEWFADKKDMYESYKSSQH